MGTHIPIKAPYVDEHIYVNRKRFLSLNIQVVCNADGLIISYNTRYPGSNPDAFIYDNCALRTRFEAGEFGENYLLAGDSRYTLDIYLLLPLLNTKINPLQQKSHPNTRNHRADIWHTKVKIQASASFWRNSLELVENDGEKNIAEEAAECGTGHAVRGCSIANWFS
ncbi:putative nuclease HARBI1 [Penaeus chinensis]|uniref:putative nuclease HARBI1 n=1 Tax=Penaeus chinensis TaxID=139456 RepID=UPI001FB6DBF1|nr:putative nuclease HARBI1 [Penaeus chinensis]